MQRIYKSSDPPAARHTWAQGLHSRAKELERMLEVGSFDTKIRQREAELQALRQKKALLEGELGRLRRALREAEA